MVSHNEKLETVSLPPKKNTIRKTGADLPDSVTKLLETEARWLLLISEKEVQTLKRLFNAILPLGSQGLEGS